MNILYLAHRLPYPPNKGDKLRAFRHLDHLDKQHRVWCACFMDDARDAGHAAALRTHCHELTVVPLGRLNALSRGATSMALGGTVTHGYYDSPAMWRVLRGWSRRVRFDVVIAFSSSMAPYARSIDAGRRVLDLCDLDSGKWREYAGLSRSPLSLLYDIEARRLARFERECVDSFEAVTVITTAEAEELAQDVPPGRVCVVTNGVDIPGAAADRLKCREAVASGFIPGATFGKVPTIGFVGVMDYRPNVDGVCWFVAECWSRIRDAYPGAVFRIAGRNPTRKVRRLTRTPGVQVIGEVSDVAVELRHFDISIAPLRIARGLQNKVLEAMAAGLPVIVSEKAAKGIAAVDGQDYLVARSSRQFVDQTVRLLCDPLERQRIGENAQRFVAAHHSWPEALRRFEFITTGVVENSMPRGPSTAGTMHDQHQPTVNTSGPC